MTALALAVGLAGCDLDDDDGETTAAVEGADEVVVTDEDDDTVVTVDDTEELTVVEGSDEAAAALAEAVAATRVADGRTSFSASVDSTAAADGVIGEGVSSEGAYQATMQVRGELAELYGATDADVEVRVVGGFAYLYWPALLADADLDASWLSAPVGEGEPNVGDLVERARLSSPAEALALLDGATNVAELEEEFVDGVPMAHYVATVELGDAAAAAGISADILRELGGEADRAVEVHAYVDGDGLVRRMEVGMDRDGSRAALVVDILEVESDVTIEPPPADDVVTFAEYVAART